MTRIHVRSVEQPVNLDEGDVYDWPWLYAVQTGHWALTDSQAKILREYLLRGGFFMADDFWGPTEWEIFMDSMKKVLAMSMALRLRGPILRGRMDPSGPLPRRSLPLRRFPRLPSRWSSKTAVLRNRYITTC